MALDVAAQLPKTSFLAFFLCWAQAQGWRVPDIHVLACDWLEHRRDHAVLRCFRGFGKSTILAVYNAWRYSNDPTYRILHQGDQDRTALKTSRDTQAVLKRHPWTRQWAAGVRGEASFWWVPGNNDERNPSMQASGITSTITSSRCEEAQNDDVEVPRNITNPDNREKMRARLGEQNWCMVPGARQLFIGTPHTHDSIYDEQEALGADCLTIRMFAREHRVESLGESFVALAFAPEYVFVGVHKAARLLTEGVDYQVEQGGVRFSAAPIGSLVDFYAECSWPERFTRDDLLKRRRRTKTINAWDSQFQLHSRPLHEIRLNPDLCPAYDVEPSFLRANRVLQCWLHKARIVGAALRWDPSSGKVNSDTSALALVLQDSNGARYWHRAWALDGEVAKFGPDGKEIVGGQVHAICGVVRDFGVRRVTVETNGIGGFAPAVLRAALRQAGLPCGVTEVKATEAKNRRILEALEPLMQSRMLWMHRSVKDGPVPPQMREWNPAATNQADDFLDAGAGAITDQPERLSDMARNRSPGPAEDWRPAGGVFEAELEL